MKVSLKQSLSNKITKELSARGFILDAITIQELTVGAKVLVVCHPRSIVVEENYPTVDTKLIAEDVARHAIDIQRGIL